MVKVCILASSSAGNSTFIATSSTRILVDAGLSRKEIVQRLAAIGEDAARLDAILVTHEHSDHVCGLPVLVRKWKIPVYATHGTAPALDWQESRPRVEEFQAGSRLVIGDFDIQSFTIPHDAADPVGYTFQAEGIKVSLVTDLGYIPENVKHQLRGSHFALMESNHDLEMLKVGPYPWAVKQRVMGRKGHLSNDLVSDYIRQELDSAMVTLVLGHLSEHNNHPEIVRLVAGQALQNRSLSTRLVVAEPRQQSEAFFF